MTRSTLSRPAKAALTLLSCLGLAAIAGADPVVQDASFENVPANTYTYNPSGSAWTFNGGSGLAQNNSPWFEPVAADGSQAAFLQDVAAISQDVSGFKLGDEYQLSFYAVQRAGYTNNDITVSVDGNALETITPASYSEFTQYITPEFTATSDIQTISFSTLGVPCDDSDSVIDMVSVADVTPSPEPATFGLIAPVALGGLALLRRRRKQTT